MVRYVDALRNRERKKIEDRCFWSGCGVSASTNTHFCAVPKILNVENYQIFAGSKNNFPNTNKLFTNFTTKYHIFASHWETLPITGLM